MNQQESFPGCSETCYIPFSHSLHDFSKLSRNKNTGLNLKIGSSLHPGLAPWQWGEKRTLLRSCKLTPSEWKETCITQLGWRTGSSASHLVDTVSGHPPLHEMHTALSTWCFEILPFSDSIVEGVTVNEYLWFALLSSLLCFYSGWRHFIYSFLEDASPYMNLLWFEIDLNGLFFFWNFLFLGTPGKTAPAKALVACHIPGKLPTLSTPLGCLRDLLWPLAWGFLWPSEFLGRLDISGTWCTLRIPRRW